jgi:hypothetical protein
MPINIYKENTFEKIAWLCNDIWDLPNQIAELEKWLSKNCKSFPETKCVIDVGFDIQKDSSGGGAVISSEMMKLMGENSFDLYLSEYPSSNEE